jgi:hypothetical protein
VIIYWHKDPSIDMKTTPGSRRSLETGIFRGKITHYGRQHNFHITLLTDRESGLHINTMRVTLAGGLPMSELVFFNRPWLEELLKSIVEETADLLIRNYHKARIKVLARI